MSEEIFEWLLFFCDGAYWAFTILFAYSMLKIYSKLEDIEEKIDNWMRVDR